MVMVSKLTYAKNEGQYQEVHATFQEDARQQVCVHYFSITHGFIYVDTYW